MKLQTFKLSINGRAEESLETAFAINPATEEPICEYPLASRTQLEEAVQAAKIAFTDWRATPIEQRKKLVAAFGDIIEERREAFITLLTTEQGKGRSGAE